jgi:hypothetical protein
MTNSFFDQPASTSNLGFGTQTLTGVQGQRFKNYMVPSTGLALYMLQIRAPQPGSSVVSFYVFPLSPESVRKDMQGLTNYYDVAGDASNQGVQRIIDMYGITPVTYMIEGTTGWQLHQTDGYRYTGLQSVQALENMMAAWANYNQQQIAAGNSNLYELWFFDFFRNQYWSVVPIGPQGLRQSVQRSILVNYSFRLLGVYPLGGAIAQSADTLAQALRQSPGTSASLLTQFGTSINSTYAGVTAIAS